MASGDKYIGSFSIELSTHIIGGSLEGSNSPAQGRAKRRPGFRVVQISSPERQRRERPIVAGSAKDPGHSGGAMPSRRGSEVLATSATAARAALKCEE